MAIGDIMAGLRRRKRWTQARLAKATGLSQGYIAAIEEGRRTPSVRVQAIIAATLGVDIELFKKDEY